MIMNKKDVLGLLSAAGNVQKMESVPHTVQCWKCSKYGTQQGKGKAGFLALLVLFDRGLTGADNG